MPEPNHPSRAARTAALSLGSPVTGITGRNGAALVEERDPDGWPVVHYRVADIVQRLVRSGLVQPSWAAAADRFRRDFALAQFNPLSAQDLQRPRGAGGREHITDRVEDARDRLWQAMHRLGGMSSPSGSVAWHVIGAELSLHQWALRQEWGSGRPLRHQIATGILIASLAALDAHYAHGRTAGRRPPAPER